MSYNYGQPRTEEERRVVHKALTGEEVPPPRGARRAQAAIENPTIFWILIALHGALIAGEIYIAYRAGWLGGKS